MKLIREGRFGPPKAYKTGSVVSSYPRPLLVLLFDSEGLDVIKEPITFIDTKDVATFCAKQPAELPPICAIDFTKQPREFKEEFGPAATSKPFSILVDVGNTIVKKCPWKTIVVDSLTGLGDLTLNHYAIKHSSMLADPRKWAGAVGGMVKHVIQTITCIQSHCVFIMHSTLEKNEITGEVFIHPMLYSKLRDYIGAFLSQFFYQAVDTDGKVKVFTKSFGLVKGIGARWPSPLPDKVGPLFSDIYGKSLEQPTTKP